MPIVLALFPVMYGVDNARLYFNVAFFVVLVSLLAAGLDHRAGGALARPEVPPSTEPVQRVTLDIPGHFEHEMVSLRGASRTAWSAAPRLDADPRLPEGMQVMAVISRRRAAALPGTCSLAAGDYVYFLARPKGVAHLGRLFDPAPSCRTRLEEHRYFGDFMLHGDALVGDVASMYGLAAPKARRARASHTTSPKRSTAGSWSATGCALGGAELVVREIENGSISRVGLRLR